MLEEWIRNIPLALVEHIAADLKVEGSPIWLLARMELDRRARSRQAAA